MEIVLATTADLQKVIEARVEFFGHIGHTLDEAAELDIRTRMAEYCVAHLGTDDFAALLGVEGGEVVAAAFLLVHAYPPAHVIPTNKRGYVTNVFTRPEVQGKGYATQLMQALMDVARQRSVSQLELEASPEGQPMYRRLGFAEKDSPMLFCSLEPV